MNSKRIGNAYERQFSKDMSLWFSEGKSDDCCYRDIGSGSRFTTRKKQGKDTINKGDIVPVDLKYKPFFDLFFVDTKTMKDANFMLINYKNIKSNNILNEWYKVSSDCPHNMIPIMPVQVRNRTTIPFIVLPFPFKFPQGFTGNILTVSLKDKCPFVIVTQLDFFSIPWYDMVKLNAPEVVSNDVC